MGLISIMGPICDYGSIWDYESHAGICMEYGNIGPIWEYWSRMGPMSEYGSHMGMRVPYGNIGPTWVPYWSKVGILAGLEW